MDKNDQYHLKRFKGVLFLIIATKNSEVQSLDCNNISPCLENLLSIQFLH